MNTMYPAKYIVYARFTSSIRDKIARYSWRYYGGTCAEDILSAGFRLPKALLAKAGGSESDAP
jgi:hypothetical protein